VTGEHFVTLCRYSHILGSELRPLSGTAVIRP